MGGGGETIMRLLNTTRAAPLCALVALAATGLGGCISTATYGTGEAPETTLLREATGGMLDKLDGEEKVAIDYEPRAPLVIPPAAQLPTPSPAPSQVAGGNWPADHGQSSGERQIAAESGQTRAMSPEYVRRMKALGEITGAGRTPQEAAAARQRKLYERDPAKAFLAEREGRDEFKAALAEAEGLSRTERRYLTDPPTHYRQPAESAPAEFEDIKKGEGNFFSRLFGG